MSCRGFFTIPRKALLLFALAALVGACVLLPREKTGGDAQAAETTAAPGRTERPPVTDSLDSPWFRGLPPEAKVYLRQIAEAFRGQDGEFLAAQGETQYERDLRSRYDEEVYLALLYRVGPYSDDSTQSLPALPRLEYTAITGIEYTDWRERGPMLDITGRLYHKNGKPIPCTLMLVWRLEELKILGFYL